MSALKAMAKRGLIEVIARVAPLTWRWRASGSLVVLMYHRVLPAGSPARQTEQPGMYVSPQTLDLHLTELKRFFELVHLDDWLRWARQGAPLPRLGCAITFDDGWRDNFEFALPLLHKHGAPATIFLVASYVGSTQRYWPNRLMTLLAKAHAYPGSVEFPAALSPLVKPVLAQARAGNALSMESVERAVQHAKRFREGEIRALICAAEESCGDCGSVRDVLSGEEIVQLAATGLVRFGSHTATHFRLGDPVSASDLEREIVLSRQQLRDICGQNIDLFCYPNGETSSQALDLVRRHYLGAVTTRRGWQAPSDDPHLIHRVGLHEDVGNSSEGFLARVSGWL